MRDFLIRLISSKEKRAAELRKLIKEASTADEVRSLGDTLQAVLDELNDAKKQLEDLPDDNGEGGDNGDGGEGRSANPIDQGRSANPVSHLGEFRQRAQYGQPNGQSADATDSVEYRQAFMDYVMRGTPIPTELRANTLTTDVPAVIPTTLINRIMERMDEVGTILSLVTHTSYPAGVEVPANVTKPTATWTGKTDSGSGEGKGSTAQKVTSAKITFAYFKLRCEVSISMEVSTMALSAFEDRLTANIANAMVSAIETAIINGTGTGEPKGILAETPNAGQTIEVAKAGALDYATLCKAEAAVPAKYEKDAKWLMSKKTFMSFVGITDANGQPIARMNYGISGKPERFLLGREVVITEDIANYAATVTADTKFAAIFSLPDYVLNTIYDLGIKRKEDWDTEDQRTKAVMSVDGKVVDKGSLVVLVKKSA